MLFLTSSTLEVFSSSHTHTHTHSLYVQSLMPISFPVFALGGCDFGFTILVFTRTLPSASPCGLCEIPALWYCWQWTSYFAGLPDERWPVLPLRASRLLSIALLAPRLCLRAMLPITPFCRFDGMPPNIRHICLSRCLGLSTSALSFFLYNAL